MNTILKHLFKEDKPLIPKVTEEEYLKAVTTCLAYECENNIETWRFIKNVNRKYMASNLGRIKSLIYNTEYIMKPIEKGSNLYINIALSNNKRKQFRLDFLIAETFYSNPTNAKRVTHKDGDPNNCILTNLAWKI